MGESFGTVVSEIWSQMTSLVGQIVSTPLLLIGVGFTFAFGVVRLAKRLMGVRR